MSFRGKIILGVAIIQLVILVFLIYIHVKTVQGGHDTELKLRAEATTSLFSSTATNATLTNDIATLESLIAEFISNETVNFAVVYDGNNIPLAQAYRSDKNASKDDIFIVKKAIGEPSYNIGHVEIGFSDEHLDHISDDAFRQGVIVGIIGLLFVVAFAYILGTLLTRQLATLQLVANRISEGELGYQVDINGNDEIAQTAKSFNTMSERISELYERQQRVNTILNALSQAQTKFIGSNNRLDIFEELLSSTLQLTESEYGFIGEFKYSNEEQPYLQTFAISNISWNNDTKNYYDERAYGGFKFYNMNTLFGSVFTTGLPVISNSPQRDPRSAGTPKGHPPIEAFFGMPLYSGDTLIGMVGLANRESGYSQSIVSELQALWTVSASIMVAYQMEEERIQMENELRESEERFSLVAQGTNDGMWDWNLTTGEIYYSSRWKEMLDIDANADFEGFQDWQLLIHPDDLGMALEIWTDCLDGELETFSFEYRLISMKGNIYWVLCRGTVFKNALGNAIRMAGSHTDITKQKRDEISLEKSAKHTRAILDNVVDVILTVDDTGLIMECNPAVTSTFDYEADELIGSKIEDLVHLNMAELLSLDAQTDFENETIARKKDGSEITVDIDLSAITNSEHEQLYVCVIRDITQRKKSEPAIKKAHEAAIDAARTKSEFLANMSHEIRTPLHGILGMLQLTEQTPLDEKQKNFVSTAHRSATHLMEIIDDILDFSKIEAGKMDLESIPFNLRELLEDVTRLYAQQAKNKSIQLEQIMPANIPDYYYGDPAKLKQIFNNLVSNAIKFTKEGSVLIRVTILADLRNEATLRIEVQDTGIGISGEAQQNIFSAFKQADNTMARKYGGTGLGLAICKQLADLMNGDLILISSPDKGSRFIFSNTFQYAQEPQTYELEPLQGKRAVLIDINHQENITDSILLDYLDYWKIDVTHEIDEDDFTSPTNRPELDYVILHKNQYNDDRLRETLEQLSTEIFKIIICETGESIQKFEDIKNVTFIEKPIRQSDVYNSLIPNIRQDLKVLGGLKTFTTGKIKFRGRILLAEDNAVNQEVSKELLSMIGLQVDIANNGVEAIEQFNKNQYALILMDCQMPEMDGFEATINIRRLEQQEAVKETTIIALTANAMKGDREKCLAVGMNDYLSKPFTEQQLVETLSRWLPRVENSNGDSSLNTENSIMPQETATQADNESTIVNYTVVNGLKQILRERFTGMMEKFEINAEKLIQDMYQALQAGEAETLHRLAHTLKGSSGTVGAQKLHEVSAILEEKAKSGDLTKIEILIEHVKAEFERFKAIIPELKHVA